MKRFIYMLNIMLLSITITHCQSPNAWLINENGTSDTYWIVDKVKLKVVGDTVHVVSVTDDQVYKNFLVKNIIAKDTTFINQLKFKDGNTYDLMTNDNVMFKVDIAKYLNYGANNYPASTFAANFNIQNDTLWLLDAQDFKKAGIPMSMFVPAVVDSAEKAFEAERADFLYDDYGYTYKADAFAVEVDLSSNTLRLKNVYNDVIATVDLTGLVVANATHSTTSDFLKDGLYSRPATVFGASLSRTNNVVNLLNANGTTVGTVDLSALEVAVSDSSLKAFEAERADFLYDDYGYTYDADAFGISVDYNANSLRLKNVYGDVLASIAMTAVQVVTNVRDTDQDGQADEYKYRTIYVPAAGTESAWTTFPAN